MELVTELPEHDPVDAPTPQFGMVEMRLVDDWDAPPRPSPTVSSATITWVTQQFSINFKGPDDESMTNLAMDSQDRVWHELDVVPKS